MDSLRHIAPAQYCRFYYAFMTAAIVIVTPLSEDLSKVLLHYGVRSTGKEGAALSQARWIQQLQKISRSLQVPHGWFTHFYVLSVAWSCFWVWQLASQGAVMRLLAELQVSSSSSAGGAGVDIGRVMIALALMALQGARRLYESFFVTRHGKTPMMVAFWGLGLLYYTANGVAVWIDGSDAILESWSSQDVAIVTPRNVFGIAGFLYFSFVQNKCHRHLASLKKYSLPTQGWFKYIVCPHYTAEILLYTALAFVAAPPQRTFNTLLLWNVAVATSNLGVTAGSAKRWYSKKFGEDSVKGRWCMIPFVY